jgi:predicted lipid-binding transport protein (Tim44 family)
MPWIAVTGLIIGGVAVAPFAARLAGRMPQHVMGTLVGGLMLIVNGSVLGKAMAIPMAYGIAASVIALGLTGLVARRAYQYDLAERAKRQVEESQPLEQPA